MLIEPWMLRTALVIGALVTATGALLVFNVWLERRNWTKDHGTGEAC